MRKKLIIIIFLLTLISTSFFLTNFNKYKEYSKTIEKKELEEKKIKEERKKIELDITKKLTEYEMRKNEKKVELEVYEKWKKENEKMESYLQ